MATSPKAFALPWPKWRQFRLLDLLPGLKAEDSDTSRCRFLFQHPLLLWFPARD